MALYLALGGNADPLLLDLVSGLHDKPGSVDRAINRSESLTGWMGLKKKSGTSEKSRLWQSSACIWKYLAEVRE